MPSKQDINTYTNPETNEYEIQSQSGFPPGSSATLFDLTGRLISSYPLSGTSNSILVTSLAPGSYQCRIIAGNTVVVKKVVVLR